MNSSLYYIPILLIFGVMYFMMFRSEKKKRAKYEDMLNGVRLNDEILTRGGILGKVVNVKDEYLVIESGPDRVKLKVAKRAIAEVYAKEENNEVIEENK